ncbi:MAG: tRNA lysidine(34) synthetase TilS [Rhodothermales bacterium]
MDSLLERVDAFIRRHALLDSGEPVVVGISGGADSIVLAAMLLDLGHPLLAVHVNFGLRGAASAADEAFVRQWCRERNIDLVVRSVDTLEEADASGASVQEAARHLRYAAFRAVALDGGVRKVAVGHHRDDQAETVLLHLFRGTGPEGLAGMPVRRPIHSSGECEVVVVRPMLCLRRAEIESYAQGKGFAWRDDETNTQPKYRRGALRGEILPLLEKHFGASVVENVARSGDLVRDYLEASLKADLEAAFGSALRSDEEGGGSADLAAIRNLPDVLRHRVFIEALRRWLPGVEANARAAQEIDELVDAQPGGRVEYGMGVVWRERDRLYFSPAGKEIRLAAESLDAGASVRLPHGILRAQRLPHPPEVPAEGAPLDVYLDARSIRFPLTVRPWTTGDRFVPLGMRGTKKVSDFLTDERVRPHRKAGVHVVESDGRIVWVVALRIAHGVRLLPDSSETVQLSYDPDAGAGHAVSSRKGARED